MPLRGLLGEADWRERSPLKGHISIKGTHLEEIDFVIRTLNCIAHYHQLDDGRKGGFCRKSPGSRVDSTQIQFILLGGNMNIWTRTISVEELTRISESTAVGHLGVEFTEVGDDYIVGRVLVNERTKDADGLLHRGIPVLLAETLGSIGAACSCSLDFLAVGLAINANHFKEVTNGWITGTARPVEIGTSTHVWKIDVQDDQDQLICTVHITMKLVESKVYFGQSLLSPAEN
jgi:uncharacterized protein (TIGR00369 family)